VDREFMIKKGYVYILKSENGKFYIGSTDEPRRRSKQHSLGHTQTTRNMHNFRPVLIQEYDSLESARKIERKIKNLKRKDYIEKMVREGYIRLEL